MQFEVYLWSNLSKMQDLSEFLTVNLFLFIPEDSDCESNMEMLFQAFQWGLRQTSLTEGH